LDWLVAWTRAGIAVGAAGVFALALLSGGTRADPRTPAALPGLPPPFLGTAVVGSGGRTAAVDAYGDVVGLWAPGPAGRSLIYNPADRQAAGSVPADTGIVARMPIEGGSIPLWRAGSVSQRYLPGTSVLRTTARFGRSEIQIVRAIRGGLLECVVSRRSTVESGSCPSGSITAAARADRRWLARAHPLGAGAPGWARAVYRRSLLVLRALTDRRSGAVAAGARDGWAYVWPRDASAVAMAFAVAGYRAEARRVVRFLLGLDLGAAARFRGTAESVSGRAAQGDAQGWTMAAARAAVVSGRQLNRDFQVWTNLAEEAFGGSGPWTHLADYQEGDSGDYLGNALAETAMFGTRRDSRRIVGGIRRLFGTRRGLVRRARDPSSGLDSAAAWAVRPFPQPRLFPLVRRTLLRLAAGAGRYGIVPSEGWTGGVDPWTAPTAWTAWSLAALANAERARSLPGARRDRRAALQLMADLRRAATPAGLLPERVDARTGIPRSTTPLAWSHAFTILALRELWPGRLD
jgi:glucoamylase